MQVYLYLLRHGRALGISEVQRSLGFSSPSIAAHHLEKLISLGVVERNERGEYVLIRKVDVGVLSAFAQVRGRVLPRLGFYGGFIVGLTSLYIVTSVGKLNAYALLLGFASSVIVWYEAIRAWLARPTAQ